MRRWPDGLLTLVDSRGIMRPAGPAPYLDYVEAPDGAAPDISGGLALLTGAEGDQLDHRQPASRYLAEVQLRRLAEIGKARGW